MGGTAVPVSAVDAPTKPPEHRRIKSLSPEDETTERFRTTDGGKHQQQDGHSGNNNGRNNNGHASHLQEGHSHTDDDVLMAIVKQQIASGQQPTPAEATGQQQWQVGAEADMVEASTEKQTPPKRKFFKTRNSPLQDAKDQEKAQLSQAASGTAGAGAAGASDPYQDFAFPQTTLTDAPVDFVIPPPTDPPLMATTVSSAAALPTTLNRSTQNYTQPGAFRAPGIDGGGDSDEDGDDIGNGVGGDPSQYQLRSSYSTNNFSNDNGSSDRFFNESSMMVLDQRPQRDSAVVLSAHLISDSKLPELVGLQQEQQQLNNQQEQQQKTSQQEKSVHGKKKRMLVIVLIAVVIVIVVVVAVSVSGGGSDSGGDTNNVGISSQVAPTHSPTTTPQAQQPTLRPTPQPTVPLAGLQLQVFDEMVFYVAQWGFHYGNCESYSPTPPILTAKCRGDETFVDLLDQQSSRNSTTTGNDNNSSTSGGVVDVSCERTSRNTMRCVPNVTATTNSNSSRFSYSTVLVFACAGYDGSSDHELISFRTSSNTQGWNCSDNVGNGAVVVVDSVTMGHICFPDGETPASGVPDMNFVGMIPTQCFAGTSRPLQLKTIKGASRALEVCSNHDSCIFSGGDMTSCNLMTSQVGSTDFVDEQGSSCLVRHPDNDKSQDFFWDADSIWGLIDSELAVEDFSGRMHEYFQKEVLP